MRGGFGSGCRLSWKEMSEKKAEFHGCLNTFQGSLQFVLLRSWSHSIRTHAAYRPDKLAAAQTVFPFLSHSPWHVTGMQTWPKVSVVHIWVWGCIAMFCWELQGDWAQEDEKHCSLEVGHGEVPQSRRSQVFWEVSSSPEPEAVGTVPRLESLINHHKQKLLIYTSNLQNQTPKS